MGIPKKMLKRFLIAMLEVAVILYIDTLVSQSFFSGDASLSHAPSKYFDFWQGLNFPHLSPHFLMG